MPVLLNGVQAISTRFVFAWRGVWMADLEVTPDSVEAFQLAASSKIPAVLIVDGADVPVTLTGVLDPRATGTFSDRAMARIIGGRGGWDTILPAQQFNNPAGALLSTEVYLATGAAVKELVLDPIPKVFGENFARAAGPASSVFEDNDWFVDPITGSTIVSAWPPTVVDPTSILDFDPTELKATLSGETLVLPGAVLADPRFNGMSYIVRDVEQTFDANGSTTTAWCSSAKMSRLADTFAIAVREAAQTRYLKSYRYRFVLPGTGSQLRLQSITRDAPDLNPIDQWTGLAGAIAKITPGTEIVVGFAEGDPKYPFVFAYSPLVQPLSIEFGPLPLPLAKAPAVVTSFSALQTEVAAVVAAITAVLNIPPLTGAHVAAFAPALAAVVTATAALAAQAPLIPGTIVKGT